MNAQDKCRRIAQDCEARAMALPLMDNGCKPAAFYVWLAAAHRFIEAAIHVDSDRDLKDRKRFRAWLTIAAYSVREAKRGALCGTF